MRKLFLNMERKTMEEEKKEVAERKPVEDKAEGSFDVFISFRGEDTRNGFTSHLHKELKNHGIKSFMQSEDLEKERKTSNLLKHIEGSKIFVPVFSKNYAESKWCLREIAKIVEIKKKEGEKRHIIPVFYDVEPAVVMSSFGEAFQKHQCDEELGDKQINEWKAALTEAGKLPGYSPPDAQGNEAKLITLISKKVSDILCKVPFDIQPVGVSPCIDTLKQMLERESDGVCMTGICGMGGIGKTTLAMALYNQLFLIFESSCFLSDIRERERREGLPSLQAKLMNKAFGGNTIVGNVKEGISFIKESFRSKKVLLVLDDVDHIRQLEAFTANRGKKEEWFGEGSKVIVTTRDMEVLLQQGLQEDDIYFPTVLNFDDSLQLFCDHAFLSDQPLVGFEELSSKIVEVAKGLPLALKVFGTLFYNLKEKKKWEQMLKKLKRYQHKKVHERLRISYDGLDDRAKSVFLDIACFFIRKHKEYPVRMWEACNYSPETTLEVLQHQSLIKIGQSGRFEMHDQIRDMGRMIVKEEGNPDPSKCSRLWSEDQVLEVLRDAEVSLGNPDVQGIDFQKVRDEVIEMSWEVMEMMSSLRMIIIGEDCHRSFECQEKIIPLPSNLRWFNWNYCPYEKLAFDNAQHEKICVLDLIGGQFLDFRLHSMEFPELKVLDLTSCKNLIRAPDFTHLPSLEKLVLDYCYSLTEMDDSIGHLEKLVKLSMRECRELKGLPAGLCKLISLEYLVLSGCKNISVLQTQIGDLTSLKHLGLSGTSISALPDSIGSLQSLEHLDLSECSSLESLPDSIGGLKSLSSLSLYECKKLEQLPNSMGMLTSLKRLNIRKCESLREVPGSLGDLNNDLQISLRLPDSLKPVQDKTGTSTATPFDVFISFRGMDTKSFTSHLHERLKSHDITSFIDSENLGKGKTISDMCKRIEGSRIFVPVFSKNYADSKWCLREIAKMAEINRIEGKKRPIFPIFYHVNPSDVRHCRGSFGKAFKNHQQDKELGEEEINEWKSALRAAGQLPGYCLSRTEGNEAVEITRICKDVSDRLYKDVPLDIQPVGMVFGSPFCDLKEKQEWEELVEKLKSEQHNEVHDRLKIIYDSLDHMQQSVFLDIACFFIGHDKAYPVHMWEACGYFPTTTLKALQHKSLIKIDKYDRFEMHDQIRDMGRMIVKQQGSYNPLKYSRPWSRNQILKVLRDAKVSRGNPYVHCLDFEALYPESEDTRMNWKAIEAMPQLRMITRASGNDIDDEEEIIRLPSNIGWFQWEHCPYQTLEFLNNWLEQLAILDLSFGCFRDFGWRSMEFPNLKVLNLSSCKNLIWTPDFTHLPSLEVLTLDNCWSLAIMDESIRHLENLMKLSMRGCLELVRLPAGLCKLTSLEYLDLSYCESLRDVPDSLGNLNDNLQISIKGCSSLEKLPNSIRIRAEPCYSDFDGYEDFYGCFKSFRKLTVSSANIVELDGCKSLRSLPGSLCYGMSVHVLSFDGCESLEEIPDSIGMRLECLKVLNLSGCTLLRRILPESIENLRSLSHLSLRDCRSLKKLPECIGRLLSLEELNLSGCTLLTRIPESMANLKNLKCLSLKHCQSLKKLPTECINMLSLEELDLFGCCSLRKIPKSIGNLKSLKCLNLKGCPLLEELPESMEGLESLEELHICCGMSVKKVPDFIGKLKDLQKLSLWEFKDISKFPGGFPRIKEIEIGDSPRLYSLPQLPSSLAALEVSGCPAFRKLPDVSTLNGLEQLWLAGCKAFTDLSGLGSLKSLKELFLIDRNGLSGDLMEKLSQTSFEQLRELFISGTRKGSDLLFGLPKAGQVNELGFSFCLTEELPSNESRINVPIQVLIEGKIVAEAMCTAEYKRDDSKALEMLGVEGNAWYMGRLEEGEEIFKYIRKEGHAKLRVPTTSNHYRLWMAHLHVSYSPI